MLQWFKSIISHSFGRIFAFFCQTPWSLWGKTYFCHAPHTCLFAGLHQCFCWFTPVFFLVAVFIHVLHAPVVSHEPCFCWLHPDSGTQLPMFKPLFWRSSWQSQYPKNIQKTHLYKTGERETYWQWYLPVPIIYHRILYFAVLPAAFQQHSVGMCCVEYIYYIFI